MNYVILDFDGTIADTETYWTNRKARFLRDEFKIGRKHSYDLAGSFAGRSLRDFVSDSYARFGREKYVYEEIESQIDSRSGFDRRVNPIAGSIEYMKFCSKMSISLFVCTNSPPLYVSSFASAWGIESLIKGVYSTYGTGKPKPSPAIYEHIAKGVTRTGTILHVVEDSASGVEAASKAGLTCVWLGRDELDLHPNVLYAKSFTEVTAITTSINSRCDRLIGDISA